VALAAGAAGSLATASPHRGVSAFDEHSLMTSIEGDRFEVAGGRLAEAKDEVREGTNRQVRQASRTELPTLREHLKLSRAALKAAAG
jgi:hypothetical protein